VIEQFASDFLARISNALAEVQLADINDIVQTIIRAFRDGNAVYIMGNGGSSATASHLACDLCYAECRTNSFSVACLSDNVPLLTALGNDLGYYDVFSGQLDRLLGAGDVVIVLSVSGDSENILRAATTARKHGAASIGFLGSNGGRARALLDHSIVLTSADFPVVESVHCVLMQMVANVFRRCIVDRPDYFPGGDLDAQN
jgi:D-sedoheptulose 7-phosphate isomerase